MSYLEKVIERDVLDRFTHIISVLKKEHIGQFSIDDIWMLSRQFNQINALLSTISSSPEGH